MSHQPNVGTTVLWTCWLFLAVNALPHGTEQLDSSLNKDRVPLQNWSGSDTTRKLSIDRLTPHLSSRFKRSSEHIVTECIHMATEEGEYFYKATTVDGNACGIYLIAEPNQKVEIRFSYFDVPCSNGGLVAFLDGWELNGQMFPSPYDYPNPPESRFREFCDVRKIKHTFISSSNAALIQYRMPYRGSGFSISVRFIRNPTPCNVLLQGYEDIYTLRNYEKRSNCTVSTLFPSAVKIQAINVGIVRADVRSSEVETGIIHKCQKRGLDDYVQIGGSIGLDNTNMVLGDSVCGLDSRPARFEELIDCGTTTVRLVSSGAYDNSVTIRMRQLNAQEDMNSFMSVICSLEEVEK